MKKYIQIFQSVKRQIGGGLLARHGLVCKVGYYGECPVLKLQKEFWTNDSMRLVPNTSGIFFSIWLTEESEKQHRLLYNIHALKLRGLHGFKITSRDFAEDFRVRFVPLQAGWSNVSTDFGPQTLMQGWIDLNLARMEEDVAAMMNRFAKTTPIIDKLLWARRAD